MKEKYCDSEGKGIEPLPSLRMRTALLGACRSSPMVPAADSAVTFRDRAWHGLRRAPVESYRRKTPAIGQ